jgi:hypothetical protein
MQTAIVDAPVEGSEKGGPRWVESLPARLYKTPMYGDVPVTPDKLQNFIKNFKENVRGQEILIDFDHMQDKAKGNKAAGQIKDATLRPSSDDPATPALWTLIEFTEEAKKEIEDKQWRYFSLEWDDMWEDTDGNKHKDVIIGGALTNRPIVKRTLPINFSETMWKELDEEDKKYFAVKTLDRMAGESKEWEHSEPGTGNPPQPRTDEDGSDDPAIEGGWRRDTPPIVEELEQEASVTPPVNEEGGNKVDGNMYEIPQKEAQELLRVLDLEVDAKPEKVLDTVKHMFGELKAMQKKVDVTDQEKKFAEQYPEYWEQHNKLMEKSRNAEAKAFSESVKTLSRPEGNGLKTTKFSLTPNAQEKVEEIHKKFAEGSVTQEDFEECLKVIMKGGIVEFGERGSDNDGDEQVVIDSSTATGIAASKRMFSELMAKKQRDNPEMSAKQALDAVANEHPDLFEASRVAIAAS